MSQVETAISQLDPKLLLKTLRAFRRGDFSARLPSDEGQLSSVFFARAGAPARILTEEDAELIWLAGLNHGSSTEVHLSEALKDTDPLNERADGVTAKLTLPMVLYRFYLALGQKRDITLDALAAETELSRKAVQYLVISQPYRNTGAWLGEHVVPNTKRLAREVRSSLLPARSEED